MFFKYLKKLKNILKKYYLYYINMNSNLMSKNKFVEYVKSIAIDV